MSFDYFEHAADIGVIGRGATPEEAFEGAAEAMFAIMVDPAQVRPLILFAFAFVEDDLELALVTWLNRLLSEARQRGLALGRFSLKRAGGEWQGGSLGRAVGCRHGARHRGEGCNPDHAACRAGRWRLGSPLRGGCLSLALS